MSGSVIAEAVLYRLDTPELANALAGRVPNPAQSTALRNAIDDDVAQLEELTQLYATRSITAVEWVQARSAIETRLTESRRQLAQAAGAGAINDYIGKGAALRNQWPTLTLDRQRVMVRAVLTHVVICCPSLILRTKSWLRMTTGFGGFVGLVAA